MKEIFLGVSSRCDASGVALNDGGAAAWTDGASVCALAEERLSRAKHGSGFALAARECLAAVGARPGDTVHCGFSSALDRQWPVEKAAEELRRELQVQPGSVAVFGHHSAHAAASLHGLNSGSGTCLVVDARGNLTPDGWEATTAHDWVIQSDGGLGIEQTARFDDAGRGWGQAWRGATKAAGFRTYHDASKLMALAGTAAQRGVEPLWDVDDDELVSTFLGMIDSDRPAGSTVAAVRAVSTRGGWSPTLGWRNLSDGSRSEDPRELLANLELARSIQLSYERWLCRTLDELESTSQTTLLSGGVAGNCVAAGVARSRVGDSIRIGPAPGDDGLALGVLRLTAAACGVAIPQDGSPFLGPAGRTGQLTKTLLKAGWSERGRSSAELAELLDAGSLVARIDGRSEYGPRALGARSLLCSPMGAGADNRLDRLRAIKRREAFQPFGVSVGPDFAATCSVEASPYMSFASSSPWTERLPGAVRHDDGTVRFQVVDAGWDPMLAETLDMLWQSGAAPCLVNTSLNARGMPLVQYGADLDDLSQTVDLVDAIMTEESLLQRF